MKIKEIGFVAIPVTDMTRARSFYEEVLGLKTSEEMMSGKWIEYSVGDDTLAIANVGGGGGPRPTRNGRSLRSGRFRRGDQAIKRSTCTFRGRAVRDAVLSHGRVQDPDGNKLMIHKLKPENEKGVCL